MKLNLDHAKRKKSYLYKLIWLSCISVCIPVILASVAYHFVSVQKMELHLLTESESSLQLMKDRAERVIQGIESESLQLANDPLTLKIIQNTNQEQSIIWHVEFLGKLSLIKNMNGFINEVFLYIPHNDLVLSNEYGTIERKNFKYEQDIEQLLESDQPSQWIQHSQSIADGHITFARLLPIGSSGAKGILAFEIDALAMGNFLETNTIILTKDNEFIIMNYFDLFQPTATQEDDLLERIYQLEGIKTIIESTSSNGHFAAADIYGNAAQFQYMKNVFNRTYVSVIPEAFISSQFGWIRGMTILIVFSFVIIGFILTSITSKKAYSPIERLLEHSHSLNIGRVQAKGNELEFIKDCLDHLSSEKENLAIFIENSKPTLREKCLQQILDRDYTRAETVLQDCNRYGIDCTLTNIVLIVEVENIYRINRFLPEEKGVVSFALVNVMLEILRNQNVAKGYVIPYHGAGVAILQYPSELEQSVMHKQTLAYIEEFSTALRDFLSFDVAVGIGRYYSHIADVSVSYNEAQTALQYRMFPNLGSILFIEDIEVEKKHSILRYPFELEANIIDALERKQEGIAVENLTKFADLLQMSQSHAFILQCYHILLSSIIVSMEKQSVNMMEIMEHNFFQQLKSKKTFKDLHAWFAETVFTQYIYLTQNGIEENEELGIQYICKYIREHCREDLSLVQCAEMIGISPSYLSRLFKKEMGMNFLEYVAESKIAEAKKLLKETDQNISEIAQQIGYSERNLNRVFQRHVQTSPGNYRMQHR